MAIALYPHTEVSHAHSLHRVVFILSLFWRQLHCTVVLVYSEGVEKKNIKNKTTWRKKRQKGRDGGRLFALLSLALEKGNDCLGYFTLLPTCPFPLPSGSKPGCCCCWWRRQRRRGPVHYRAHTHDEKTFSAAPSVQRVKLDAEKKSSRRWRHTSCTVHAHRKRKTRRLFASTRPWSLLLPDTPARGQSSVCPHIGHHPEKKNCAQMNINKPNTQPTRTFCQVFKAQ